MIDNGMKILTALVDHRFSALTASELAGATGLSNSTVRRWLPILQESQQARPCHHHGLWTATGQGELDVQATRR